MACFSRVACGALLYISVSILPALAAPDGTELYKRHCAVCHGQDGNGGVGVPLALPSFLDSVSDDYLAKSIRIGRPGRVMPAFKRLSDAEVNAVVAHVRDWSKQPAPTYATTRIKGDTERGDKLYQQHCAACHGARGEGGQGTGVTMSRPRDLPIIAPAINNPGFLASATDAFIKATLMEGREGTPMYSFLKAGLTEQDIDDVVAFVRAFGDLPPDASASILEAESAVLVQESPYSVEETVANVKNAILGANFRLIRTQYLDQDFVAEGKANKKRVLVYACSFSFLNEALKVDPRIGLFLPCRITIAEHAGKTQVMIANPLRLSAMFNNAELNEMCKKMYGIYMAILEEATL